MSLYELYSGKLRELRIWTRGYNAKPFSEGDIINVCKVAKKNKRKPETNPETGKTEWVSVENDFEYWLESWAKGGDECYD